MKNRKKYLMILTDLNMGGVTTAAINFCNELYRRGNDVDVLVMTDFQKTEEKRFSEGIKILHLSGKDKFWNLGWDMIRREKSILKKVFWTFWGMIKKMINRKNLWIDLLFGKRKRFFGYDAVLAYRQCSPCYYFALNCVEAKKKAAFVHGDIKFMGDISTWEKYLLEFDAVAYVSEAVKNGFVNYNSKLAQNATTIYNVFNIEEILCKAAESCELEFDKNLINIVTVSRMEATMKGTDRIPEVCSILKKKYGNRFHWYVVGGGPDLNTCEKRAEELLLYDCLTFVGQKSNPYKYLSKADICLFTTKTEAFGMVVVESLVLGVPVVSTRYPAIEEIIVDGKNGIIAEQNIDSIVEKTSMIFDDSSLLETLKNECIKYKYDNDRSYTQLEKALFDEK